MRTRLILIVSLVFVGVLVAGGYFFFTYRQTNNDTPTAKDFFSAFFPFGQGSQAGNKSGANGASGTETPQKVTARLRHVSAKPTAGVWFGPIESTTTPPRIRFMERTTGHIFETPVDSYAEVRLSNTTIPLIQDIIEVNPSALILRTLADGETISNSLGILNATTSEQSMNTLTLKGFTRMALSSGGAMLTVTETSSGSEIALGKPDGSESRTILVSPIRSWIPLAGGEHFFLESAPSSGLPGFLYEIKNNGALVPLVGEIPGLLALPSPTGRYVLYSGSAGSRVALAMVDTATGQRYDAPLGTLATKCAWIAEDAPRVFCGVSDPITATGTKLPDDWLLGKVAFNDGAWIVRLVEGSAHSLGKLEEMAGMPIDVMGAKVSPDQRYAVFLNKNDLSSWSLDLTRDR